MAHAGYGSNDTGEYDNPDIFTGYITKRGHMVRNWKRRFFYINGLNRKLYYYVNSGEYRANVRPLGEHTVTTLAHWPDKMFGMEFVCNGGKVFFACAESQEGLNKIFQVLAPAVAVGHDQNLWGVPNPHIIDDEEVEPLPHVDLVSIIQQRIRTWLARWRLYNLIFQNYPRAMQLRACIVMKKGKAPSKILVCASLVQVSRSNSHQWSNISTAESYMKPTIHHDRLPNVVGLPPSWSKRKSIDLQCEVEYTADILLPFVQLTKVCEDLKIVLTFIDGSNGKRLGQSVLGSLYAHHWKQGTIGHTLLSVGGASLFGATGSVDFEPPQGPLRTSLVDGVVQRRRARGTYEFTAAGMADNDARDAAEGGKSAPSLLRLLGLNVHLGCIGSCPITSPFANVSLDSGSVNDDFDDAFADAISPAASKQQERESQEAQAAGLTVASAAEFRFGSGELGMELLCCTEERAAGYFRVKKVHQGGQAEKNMICEGDVIVGVNGSPPSALVRGTDGSPHDFIAAVAEQPRPLVLNVCSQQQEKPPGSAAEGQEHAVARKISHARSRVTLHFFPAEMGASMSGALLCCAYHGNSRAHGRRQWELMTCAVVGGRLVIYQGHPLLSVPEHPHLELRASQIKRILCPVVRESPASHAPGSMRSRRFTERQRAIYYGTVPLRDQQEPEFIVRFVADQPRFTARISGPSRRRGEAEHHVNAELGFKLPVVGWGTSNRGAHNVQRQRLRTKWALAFNDLVSR
jgi:hypothetical protein